MTGILYCRHSTKDCWICGTGKFSSEETKPLEETSSETEEYFIELDQAYDKTRNSSHGPYKMEFKPPITDVKRIEKELAELRELKEK